MVIRAQTDTGEPVRLTVHPLLQWTMGITATLASATVIWGVATVANLDTRVSVIEANRFTRADAQSFVTLREYDAHYLAVQTQLQRIETKIDQIQGSTR